MLKSVLVCTALIICLTARSQHENEILPVLDLDHAFFIGIKGGIGLSFMDALPNEAYPDYGAGHRAGLHLGILALVPLNGYWSFRPEIGYSSQGYRQSVGLNLYAETVKQGYIQVPLQLQYTSDKGHCFYTGPQAGFLVYHKSGYKRVDVAWNGGLAFITRWRVGVDVRYSAGLMNTVDKYNVPLRKAKNKLLQAGLVYLFASAKKQSPASRP